MRLLFIGPSPYLPTGFGRAIRYFSRLASERGYDVAVVDTQRVIPPDTDERIGRGVTLYPGVQGDTWFRAVAEFRPDVVVVLFSLWVEPYRSFARLMAQSHPSVKVVLYAPFEYLTLSDFYFEALLGAHRVLVPNRYAERYLRLHVPPDYVGYVPHGYDPKYFRRLDSMTDVERAHYEFLRREFGDRFTWLFVARNNLRKEIATLIMAFRLLPSEVRRDSTLALYTRLQEVTPSALGPTIGWDIARLARKYGVGERVYVFHNWATAEWGIPDTLMNVVYNASDVYVHPSSGEGFGLPLVEAMATGRPVVASYNTSMIEFCGENEDYCLLARPANMVESWEGFCFTPTDVRSLAEKMELMYYDAGLRRRYAERSLERARQYTWEAAFKHFERELDIAMRTTSRVETFRHEVIPEDFEVNPMFADLARLMRR
ncbi:MAG: glycosyltransferase family 4 protein [Nanopusillaceae archaeon]